ncbi:MAG TPA: hypothetical protein ENH15_05670 [Actinobacteria bacterium]|nr:hypothetical protein [Actinomycetota bacterium]
MNNVIMRKLVLTANYQSLAAEKVVGSFVISVPPSNADDAVFLGDAGDDVPWVPGEWHGFNRVNLAEIQVKGTPGDIVTVVGGTW